MSVREGLIQGEENQPYLQREDRALLKHGKVGTSAASSDESGVRDVRLRELIDAPMVPTRLQSMAYIA